MSHHVCSSLQLCWKTTVDDGVACSRRTQPAAVAHNGPVIIAHIITARHSICHADNLIGDFSLAHYILEGFSHSVVQGSVCRVWGLLETNI